MRSMLIAAIFLCSCGSKKVVTTQSGPDPMEKYAPLCSDMAAIISDAPDFESIKGELLSEDFGMQTYALTLALDYISEASLVDFFTNSVYLDLDVFHELDEANAFFDGIIAMLSDCDAISPTQATEPAMNLWERALEFKLEPDGPTIQVYMEQDLFNQHGIHIVVN